MPDARHGREHGLDTAARDEAGVIVYRLDRQCLVMPPPGPPLPPALPSAVGSSAIVAAIAAIGTAATRHANGVVIATAPGESYARGPIQEIIAMGPA